MNHRDTLGPTAEQLSSDRAVFRFQRYVERFLDDLKLAVSQDNPLSELTNAVYVPIAPRSPNGEAVNYYLAKFCRTYRFSKLTKNILLDILEDGSLDIGGYFTAKGEKELLPGLEASREVSLSHLVALFDARRLLANDRQWEPVVPTLVEFKNALSDSDKPDAAHEKFVDAVSEIPYSGMLPTLLDNVVENVVKNKTGFAIKFDGKVDGPWDLTLMQEGIKEGSILENLPELSVANHPDQKETLEYFLLNFANPFLNDPEWQEASDKPYPNAYEVALAGLALPLYERTEIRTNETYRGAFLGWVILQTENEIKLDSMLSEWPAIALLSNSLANAVLAALADEVLSEYADHTSLEPLDYLCKRMEDLEGFRVAGSAGDTRHTVHWAPLQTVDYLADRSPREPIMLVRKHNTIASDNDYYENFLFPRLQRALRQLEAVHLSTQAQNLLKYKYLMSALAAPLSNLSNALTTMQRDTQELRAILYEPTQTIFESYQSISELFEEGRVVKVAKHLSCLVTHHPTKYSGTGNMKDDIESTQRSKAPEKLSEDAGRACLVTAVCRIFGIDKMLDEAPNFSAFVGLAEYAIEQTNGVAFKSLKRDLEWLFQKKLNDGNFRLESIVELKGSRMRKALGALKAVAFSPFKIETEKWHVLALMLALPFEDREKVRPVNVNSTLKLGGRSPVSFNKLLEFVRAVVTSDLVKELNELVIETSGDQSITSITIGFTCEGGSLSSENVSEITILLEPVVKRYRDFRVMAANRGSVHGPFVNLANSLMGISEKKGQGAWTVDGSSQPNVVLSVTSHKSDGQKQYGWSIHLTEGKTEEFGKLKIQWN